MLTKEVHVELPQDVIALCARFYQPPCSNQCGQMAVLDEWNIVVRQFTPTKHLPP
jgi:hypothetical protein